MIMNRKILIVLLSFAVLTTLSLTSIQAQRVSKVRTIDFLQLCQNHQTVKACNIYISGIADSVAFSKVYAKNQGDLKAPSGFCINPSVSGNEMRQKVVNYINSHTDQLNQPAGATVFTALHESYPCVNVTNGVK